MSIFVHPEPPKRTPFPMCSRLEVTFKWGCPGDEHSYVSLNCVAAVRTAYAISMDTETFL